MAGFITIPSASDILATTSVYSAALFDYLYPLALWVIGFIVAGMLAYALILKAPLAGVRQIFKGKRGGRGRRR